MKYLYINRFCAAILFTIFCQTAYTQNNTSATTSDQYKTISAGPEYRRSSFYQWLWGSNRRAEWITPVRVPLIMLDTAKGGLTPYKSGGGHQTKSLHLKNKNDKEYALRSVDKTLGAVLPKDFKNTFIEDLVNDKVSMSHPYGAAVVPVLSESAKIYHTNPQFVFLPSQPALDTFNKSFGNKLYLFEQRADGDWKDANNLGNFDKYISTEKLLEKIYDDNDIEVDQRQFVKSRLFDMFINDWDRHEDQWRWAAREDGNKKVYVPVPQDRDQALSTVKGWLLKTLIGASGMRYFQPFKDNVVNVNDFNFEERNLDRFFANQMTLKDWQSIATELQQSLTDGTIETAVKQLPPEIFRISGNETITKLKARRGHLVENATTYYKFIAKQVDIVGSKQREDFEVNHISNDETAVNIYKITKEGKRKDSPFYSRVFESNETSEIRLYGLSGEDTYTVKGSAEHPIKVRIIGGDDKDSIINVNGSGRLVVYDDKNNVFEGKERLHLSSDSAIHAFDYKSYLYEKKGLSPIFFYDEDDRFYVGLGYGILHNKWRKKPFASKQSIEGRYSITQNAFAVLYKGLFPELIGKWDLALNAYYDQVRWTDFFGLGNETTFITKTPEGKTNINFYRARTEEWFADAGLVRRFGANVIRVDGFVQNVRVINDPDRYLAKTFGSTNNTIFKKDNFAGVKLNYSVFVVNDSLVPTKGFVLDANASYTQNVKIASNSVTNYNANLDLYVPLIPRFSLAIRTGAETVAGNPEFYQYASFGGGHDVRGFRQARFWGKSAFYNSNELRFINNVRTHFFNGKAGLLAFYDDGRVWMPNEKSNTWHLSYGGGVILAPFNKILADITYGVSKEESIIQLRLSRPL